MEIIYNSVFLAHDTGFHPENKRRLISLGDLPETDISNGEQYLKLVHDESYVEFAKQHCEQKLALDRDTLTSAGTYDAALTAVGAAIMASQQNAFALVRPPGHHAYSGHGSGFCIFNNIAIATQKLVNEGKRVAVLDFDGHYGDGTAEIFYESDKVLYCSLHQYPAFPGKGYLNEIGRGAGKGFNINLPLPPGSGDDVFLGGIRDIFVPIIKQFQPDHVALSAGFDAYRDDPLLDLAVSKNGFYELGKLLGAEFENVFALLEGGYNIEALPHCVFNFLDGINSKTQQHHDESTVSPVHVIIEYAARAGELKRLIGDYWMV